MAKTWTVKEAFEAIRKNDKAAIADFGKRFPLATVALTKAASEDGTMLFGAMPERVTMRVLDAELKGDIEENTEDEDVEETKPAKKEKAEKAPAKTGKKGRPAKKAEPVEEDDAEDDADEDDTEDYSKMGAVDLFKLCKKRGIKVEPKQKASVYIKALEAADADADDEDDDDAEEEEEVKPAKKNAKKAPAKAEKKASKKDADDEDDDWDI